VAVIELTGSSETSEELTVIRHRIAMLLEWRILAPLTAEEEAEYQMLCQYERGLLGHATRV
jgi:hypothetical protein